MVNYTYTLFIIYIYILYYIYICMFIFVLTCICIRTSKTMCLYRVVENSVVSIHWHTSTYLHTLFENNCSIHMIFFHIYRYIYTRMYYTNCYPLNKHGPWRRKWPFPNSWQCRHASWREGKWSAGTCHGICCSIRIIWMATDGIPSIHNFGWFIFLTD